MIKIRRSSQKTDRTHQNLLPCHKVQPCVWSKCSKSCSLLCHSEAEKWSTHNQPALDFFSLLPTKFGNLKVCVPIWRLLEGEGVFIKREKLNDFFLLWSGERARERENRRRILGGAWGNLVHICALMSNNVREFCRKGSFHDHTRVSLSHSF